MCSAFIIKIAGLVISALTPIVIVIFGFLLNKKLESIKVISGWNKDWADEFLKCAKMYDDAVSKTVVGLNVLVDATKDRTERGKTKAKLKETEVNTYVDDIRFWDWELKKYLQFAPNNGKTLMKSQQALFDLVASLLSERYGNLEKIRAAQFVFNKAVRNVHFEILNLRK